MNSRFREERDAFDREREDVYNRVDYREPRRGNFNSSRPRYQHHPYDHDGRYGGPQYRHQEGSRYPQNDKFEEDIEKLLKKAPENKRLDSGTGQETHYEKSREVTSWSQQESQSHHHHTTDRERDAGKHFKMPLFPLPKQEHQQVQKHQTPTPGDQQIKKFGNESFQTETPTAGGAGINSCYRPGHDSTNTITSNQYIDSNANNYFFDAVQPVIQKSRSKIKIRLECDKNSDEDKQTERKQGDNTVSKKGILKVRKRNFCELCNMFFINAEALLNHESSLLHKKNLEKIKQKVDKEKIKQTADQMSASEKTEKKDTKKVWADVEKKKRVEEEDEDEEEEDTSYCRYCNQSFTNPGSFYIHTRGMLHTQNVMAAESDKSEKLSEDEGPFTTVATISAEEETRGIKVVNPAPVEAVDEDNWMELEESPTEKVKIPLEERDLAPEDIVTKNKTKMLHCEICNITCCGEEPMQQHLEGNKHRNKAAKVNAGDSSVVKVMSTPSVGDVCEVDTEALITKTLAQSSVPLIGLQYVTEFQPDDGKPRYVCNLCESKCDTNTLIPHCSGGKHRFKYFKAHYPDIHKHLSTYALTKKKSDLHSSCAIFAADIVKKEGLQKVKVKLEISKRSAIAAETLLKRSGINIPNTSVTDFIKDRQALKRTREDEDDDGDDEKVSPKKLPSKQKRLGHETDDHNTDIVHRTKGPRRSNYFDRHPYYFEERDPYRHPDEDSYFGWDNHTDLYDDRRYGARGQDFYYNHGLPKSRDGLNLDYSDASSTSGDKLVFDYSHSSSAPSDALPGKKEKLIFDYSDVSSGQNKKQIFDYSDKLKRTIENESETSSSTSEKQVFDYSNASSEKRKKLVYDYDDSSSQGDTGVLDHSYRPKSAGPDENLLLDEDLRDKTLRPAQNKQVSDLQQSNQGQGRKESLASEQKANKDDEESERLFKEFIKWKRKSAAASSSGTNPSEGNMTSSSQLQTTIPPVSVMSHATIPPAPLAQTLPNQGVPLTPHQMVPGASVPVPAPQQLVSAQTSQGVQAPSQKLPPSLKKPGEPKQKTKADQSVPDKKVNEMLGALAQTLIKSEDEAAMALQVSNALTQALLKFRLQKAPEQMEKSTSNDPQSKAIQEQNFMVTQLTQHLKQSMAQGAQAKVKSTEKQTKSPVVPVNTAGGPSQIPQVPGQKMNTAGGPSQTPRVPGQKMNTAGGPTLTPQVSGPKTNIAGGLTQTPHVPGPKLNRSGGSTQSPQVSGQKTVPLGAQQFNAYSIKGDRGEIGKHEMKAWQESLKKKALANYNYSQSSMPKHMPPPTSNMPIHPLPNMPPTSFPNSYSQSSIPKHMPTPPLPNMPPTSFPNSYSQSSIPKHMPTPPLSNMPPTSFPKVPPLPLQNIPQPPLPNIPPPPLPMEPPPPLPSESPPPPPPPPPSEPLPSHSRSQSSHQHWGQVHQLPRGGQPPYNQRGSKMSRY